MSMIIPVRDIPALMSPSLDMFLTRRIEDGDD